MEPVHHHELIGPRVVSAQGGDNSMALDEDTHHRLMIEILVAVHEACATNSTDRLTAISLACAQKLGGDQWDALEALMALRQQGHVEATRDFERGRLTASGAWMARTMAVSLT